jgi:hypothetical protein
LSSSIKPYGAGFVRAPIVKQDGTIADQFEKWLRPLGYAVEKAGFSDFPSQSSSGPQSAAIPATNLVLVGPSSGLYEVVWEAELITPASVSSVLGGSAGFQLVYTRSFDGVVVTTPAWWGGGNNGAAPSSASGNTQQTHASGIVLCYAAPNTQIQCKFGYTSVNAAEMKYVLHVSVKAL